MRGPTLLEGNDYDVMVGNLWRLLAWGLTLAEARPLVLAHAGVRTFPSPRGRRKRPRFDTIDTRAATIH